MAHYDLCVIGSGPAGQKAAIQAAKLGKSACVIERHEMPGGAALNTGTVPSKSLREAILRFTSRSEFHAPSPEAVARARATIFADLLAATQRVITKEIDVVRKHFSSNGIDLRMGIGRFTDPHTIEIVRQGTVETVTADYVAIATGTSPARPKSVPFDSSDIITSDELLHLDHLPRSMIVVGGGVIGTEYASMLAALGVRVSLVEGRNRILDFVDAEIAEALQYHLRQKDMTLRLGENVVKIERLEAGPVGRASNPYLAQATLESGKTLTADCLLYCVGRQGNTEDLNLSAAGLEADARGRIQVNRTYQTSVPHIYACGDVIGFPALASTSMEQGRLAACNMFHVRASQSEELLPYGIYAIPEISMVGWTEEHLTRENVPYEAGIAQYREIARGALLGDDIGMLKLLIHQESHAILGVHAIGTGATELIHIGQAVMALKGTAEYFVDTVFNYPTLAECYKVAALNGLNRLRNV